MLCRVLLTAIAISCTFSSETNANANGQSTQCATKDLICVLFLSGIQKEDLDVTLLKKLERRNVDLEDLNNEKVRQDCFIKYYMQNGQLPKNSTETSVHFDFASKENLTKASFADLLDTSELEILLQHLKKKHKTVKFTPENTGVTIVNRTKTDKNNINLELQSINYKIEIVSKRPMVTQKVNNERGPPTLSNVIKFWNMYMKTKPKDKIFETTTQRITREPNIALNSDEVDNISKVLENFISDKRVLNQIPKNKLQNTVLNNQYNDPHEQRGISDVTNEGSNIKTTTLKDLSFNGLVKNIYALFSKDQMNNQNKVNVFDAQSSYSKLNTQDNANKQKVLNESSANIYSEEKSLNSKENIIQSLLTNFQMNKFRDNPEITASNLSSDDKRPGRQVNAVLYSILNRQTTVPSLANTNPNTEQYEKLIQNYNAPPMQSAENFERTTKKPTNFRDIYGSENIDNFKKNMAEYQRLIQELNSPQRNVNAVRPNFDQTMLKQEKSFTNKKNLEQNTEQYPYIQQYNMPLNPVQNIFIDPNSEQSPTFLQYKSPQQFESRVNQTFVQKISNNEKTQQDYPLQNQNVQLYTTPITNISTVNDVKLLHPDLMKQIAETVKQLVLNDIQDRISSITKPITQTTNTEFVTKTTSKKELDDSNFSTTTQITTTSPKRSPAAEISVETIRPTPTLENMSKNGNIISTTAADMFAASLTKIDSEKMKQATVIIEKFIELFKHIKLMQEIKSMSMPAVLTTPKTTLLKKVLPQVHLPVIMGPEKTMSPNSYYMNPQGKSSPFDMLHSQNQFDVMMKARKHALDMEIQALKSQHTLNANVGQQPIPLNPRFQPQAYPYAMKIQSPNIVPVMIDPYVQGQQPPSFFHQNVQPQLFNEVPIVSKLNKSVTIHQSDVGSIVPIQVVNPMSLNSNILVSTPVPAGLTPDQWKRWKLMIQYGKSQADIKDIENRKQTLSMYSNTPTNSTDCNKESGTNKNSLLQLKNEDLSNKFPLFNQNRTRYTDDFRIDFFADRISKETKQDTDSKPKTENNNTNSGQSNKENAKTNSNIQDLLAEVDKIAKAFGYKNELQAKTKLLNKTDDNNNVNKNRGVNFTLKNVANVLNSQLKKNNNPNIGINYNSKPDPLDTRSKLDPRILHLNQMARILRANDKDAIFSNVYKRVYTPQKLNRIYNTQRKSPPNRHEYMANPYEDNILLSMDSIKNKEYREKGISYNRRNNNDGDNEGKIPIGYHEKLERLEERSQYKDKDWRSDNPRARPFTPISHIKPPSEYNDAPFKNFLKTQQKVNKILERLLATKTEDAARSTETI